MGFKKTKRRIKKIRKKEKVSLPDELRLDDTRSTDFGSRFCFVHFVCLERYNSEQ